MDQPPCFKDKEARKVIDKLCKENGIDDLLLKDLVEVMTVYSGSGRAKGIVEDIADCINRFMQRAEE